MSEFRRLLMAQSSGGGGRLPAEYQEVEYIERKNRNSYLGPVFQLQDIGSYIIETKFTLIHTNNSDGYIYSAGENNRAGIAGYRSGDGRYACISNWKFSYLVNAPDGSELVVEEQNSKIIVNGIEYSKTFYYYRNYGLYPFSNQYWQFDDFKMYYFKLTNNNVLERDLVPCYRKADNVCGMYDIVNDVFYAGTGTFEAGPNVN